MEELLAKDFTIIMNIDKSCRTKLKHESLKNMHTSDDIISFRNHTTLGKLYSINFRNLQMRAFYQKVILKHNAFHHALMGYKSFN